RDRVGDQLVERIAAGGRIGRAVPALVIAQHSERLAERARLVVPHRQIGGERIAEHEPGCAVGPVHLGVDGDSTSLGLHRGVPKNSFSSASSGPGACAGIMCTASISSNRAPGMVLANCSLMAGGRTLSNRPATTMVGLRMSLPRSVTLGSTIERLSAAKHT